MCILWYISHLVKCYQDVGAFLSLRFLDRHIYLLELCVCPHGLCAWFGPTGPLESGRTIHVCVGPRLGASFMYKARIPRLMVFYKPLGFLAYICNRLLLLGMHLLFLAIFSFTIDGGASLAIQTDASYVHKLV